MSYSLEGADRLTVGTSDVTMRIWLLVEEAGERGLSRDEIVAAVAPHVNAGYARRRYLKHLMANRKTRVRVGRVVPTLTPSFETTPLESARGYVLGVTLKNMRHSGSLVRGSDDRYHAGRKPRYDRDERSLDLSGDRTRLHINGNEVLRVLEPAVARHHKSLNTKLTAGEWLALERMISLYREAMRAGFPDVD